MLGRLARPACIHCRNLWLHTSRGAVQAFHYATATEAIAHSQASAGLPLPVTLPDVRTNPGNAAGERRDARLANRLSTLHRSKAPKGRQLRRLSAATKRPHTQIKPDWSSAATSRDAPVETAARHVRPRTRSITYRPIRIGLVGAPYKPSGRLVLRGIRRQVVRQEASIPKALPDSPANVNVLDYFLYPPRMNMYAPLLDGSLPLDVLKHCQRLLKICLSVAEDTVAAKEAVGSDNKDLWARRSAITASCMVASYHRATTHQNRTKTLENIETALIKQIRQNEAHWPGAEIMADNGDSMTFDAILTQKQRGGEVLYAEWLERAQKWRAEGANTKSPVAPPVRDTAADFKHITEAEVFNNVRAQAIVDGKEPASLSDQRRARFSAFAQDLTFDEGRIADVAADFLNPVYLKLCSPIFDESLPDNVLEQAKRIFTVALSVNFLIARRGAGPVKEVHKIRYRGRRVRFTLNILRGFFRTKNDADRERILSMFNTVCARATSSVGCSEMCLYAGVKDTGTALNQEDVIAMHLRKGRPLFEYWYTRAQQLRTADVAAQEQAAYMQTKVTVDAGQAPESEQNLLEAAAEEPIKAVEEAQNTSPDGTASSVIQVGANGNIDTDPTASSTVENKSFSISAREIDITSLHATRAAAIPDLSHGLGRTLFHPGIHWLQDPKTRTFNFDPRIQKPLSRDQFDFKQLPGFVRPSEDNELKRLLKESGRKFAGSTSSLSSALSQVYFALNGKKPLNTHTRAFVDAPSTFPPGAQNPASIVLNYTEEGTYLIDSDKNVPSELRPASVLSEMGHVFEKLLTYSYKEFSRFRKDAPDPFKPEESRDKREAYHYSATPSLVMRSQLDCQDSRLPKKTFDIKTRATIAIRRDQLNFEKASGYQISTARGYLGSFEREKYDLIRSAFLKYSMQARIGNMDGIFLAYHSITRMFGFEYLPLKEIDMCVSGSHEESEQAFRICVAVLEKILHQAIADMPETTLRVSFSSSMASNKLSVVVAPARGSGKMLSYELTLKSRLNGQEVDPKNFVDFASTQLVKADSAADSATAESLVPAPQSAINWEVDCDMTIHDDMYRARRLLEAIRTKQSKFNKKVTLPEGLTDEEVEVVTKQGWTIKDAMDLKRKNSKAFTTFFPVEGVTYTNKTYGIVNTTRRMAALGRKAVRSGKQFKQVRLAAKAPTTDKIAGKLKDVVPKDSAATAEATASA